MEFVWLEFDGEDDGDHSDVSFVKISVVQDGFLLRTRVFDNLA